jgi:cytoskeletal protein RodZ
MAARCSRKQHAVDTGKLQIPRAAAILVLISGGIAAYAEDQTSSKTNTTSTTTDVASGTSTTSSSSSQTSSTSTTSTGTAAATTTTSTTTAITPLRTSPSAAGQVGRLILPITSSLSQIGSIQFSDSKGCVVSITTAGGVFSVQISLRYA